MDWKSFAQRFIIILIRYILYWHWTWTANTWTANLDYNYYILWDMDFKALGLRIWILIVIFLTRLGLENSWTTNFD